MNVKFIIPILMILFFSCKDVNQKKLNGQDIATVTTSVKLNKGVYKTGENIKADLVFKNDSLISTSIGGITIEIKNISDPADSWSHKVQLDNSFELSKDDEKIISATLLNNLPESLKEEAYGIYLRYNNNDKIVTKYKTFFRVVNDDELTVFDIKTDFVNDVPVYKLDGGMSAEYVIEKSAENLTSGISHSWDVNAPGSGPNHVLGTPNYLEKSVNKTVDFYNKTFGENTEIETVLISSGFPSIPYISNALKAPVLPLHFLVSVNTVKEIRTILETANDNDIASYATLSHDPSVPYAVSWIKLLELPQVYKDFIKQHNVKNIVILGATGTSGGETKAKKIVYDSTSNEEYANRSIYIMYPGTSPDDVKTLDKKIADLKDFKQQDDYIQIADWESGINQKQLDNFSRDAKVVDSSIKVTTITAVDLGRLYALGSYSTLALMHKNKEKFDGVKGVIFNPYLISHPTIEAKKGFVPLLYWQLVGPNFTVYNMENDVFKAVKHFYPETNVKNLKLWLNSTRNFGAVWSATNLKKELTKKGYTNFIENNYTVDEVWDLSDGVESPSELLFKEVNDSYGFQNLKKWSNSLKPLTIKDIEELSEIFGGFQVETK
ncbi:hypothetical protein UMM65_12560 [Aureibaculum sp. 2210JD6-5]|uniref:hypothetical protein n=1 Tax=Aureibaculum sp. 2210JD6-5 TaxID=3103957 RepID=UPI002AADF529|nr:hypothetical protein [Aureibaculum sp. 2210JD6-5]MDY7396076.1 hypothetical protein [Aureibaculum sp. 2210JD6-5]